jgi:hypothetical protein
MRFLETKLIGNSMFCVVLVQESLGAEDPNLKQKENRS